LKVIPQKTNNFTHEFVTKVLCKQEETLESLQKESNYTALIKILFLNFWFKVKEVKNRFDESINTTVFKNLSRVFQ